MRPLSALHLALLGGLWLGGVALGEKPCTVVALAKHPPQVGAEVAVTAYILMVVRCPLCPAGATVCKACRDEFILIADRPDARAGILMLRTSHTQQAPLARGQLRTFTVRFEPESSGPRDGPIRRGVTLLEAGPTLPRPR